MRHSRSLLALSLLVAVVIVAGCTRTPASTTPSPTPTPATLPTPKPVPSYWIDAHGHINPSLSHGGLSGVDLLVSNMDKAGVGKTVLFSLIGGQADSLDVLEAYRKYPDRIIPFRGDDYLDVNDPATLNLIRADLDTGLFRGFGEIISRHSRLTTINQPADHPVMLELWKLAAKYAIPVNVHINPAERWLPEFERALTQCPGTTFIWAHSGLDAHPDVVKGMLDRHPNLYAEISALNPVWQKARGYRPFEQQINRPGWIRLFEAYPDRFLFGTDTMDHETYVEYPAIVAWVRDNVFSQLSPVTVEAIAHGNAERLFRIAPSSGAEKKPSAIVPSSRPDRMVSVTLGPTNTEDGLRQLRVQAYGPTRVASLGGRPCRVMVSNGLPNRLMYFNIQNDFIYAKATKVVVTVDYFDAGTGWFRLDYDSSDFTLPQEGRWKATQRVGVGNSGTWQTATFQLNDAYFGDRQFDHVSDFRIAGPDQDLAISRVTVSR